MQRITIVENVFCYTHKQFHLSRVTVADTESSDSSRVYTNERYGPGIQYPQNFAQRAKISFQLRNDDQFKSEQCNYDV